MMPTKDEVRRRIWGLLTERGVARFPTPIHGRIPNFEGSSRAATRLLESRQFSEADVIKVNPDYPQIVARKGVLEAGKKLLMPTPRLRKGFILLDPSKIDHKHYRQASTIRGSNIHGRLIKIEDLPHVDLIICGSVAVTSSGARVGKGGGYSELEYGILRELRLVDERLPIHTSVHDLQIIEKAPLDKHDFTVDYVATPTRTVKTHGQKKRPTGIIWESIKPERVREMPILEELRMRVLKEY